jgi:NTE family protein
MKVRGFLTAIIMLLALALQGQKVALVLSGGGSKGLAHVGVLKALEQNNIPIDYITGTSMGAVVGGLYASGYSPLEIEEFLTSDSFEKWIRGEIDEKYFYYFKKPEPNASWISLKYDFDDLSGKLKTSLPTNIVLPYQIDFAMLEFFAAASAISNYNFDSLFVPFRCMAADIDSSKAIILKDGQLGTAIRASATYPFYFKPVEIDNKLLFDGGLYNNFPVDVALEEFEPDIIIGSMATHKLRDPKKDDLLSQVMNMIISETNYTVPGDKGIMITTDLPVVNVIDFSRKKEFVDSGYVAAMNAMEEIHELIHRSIEKDDLFDRRQAFNNKKPPVIIDSININGLNKSQSYYIRKLLQKRSKYISLESLKNEYFKLLGDNKIKEVFPTLVYYPESGFYTLDLDIKPAEHFVTEFGGNISSRAANAAFVGIEYRLLRRIGLNLAANGYFGRFYSSANAEIRLDFPSFFPYFITMHYTYNHKDYFSNTTYFFEDKTPSFLVQNENHFGLNIGLPATNSGKISAGGYSGYTLDDYYQDNYFTRADTADRTRFNFTSFNLKYEFNTFNNKQLATSGAFFHISFQYINGQESTTPGTTASFGEVNIEQDHSWFQLHLMYDKYFRMTRWMKLGIYGEGMYSNLPDFSNYTATILRSPAFSPIPEMKTLFLPKYRSPVYVAGGLKMLFTLLRNFYFRTEAYYFQPYRELVPGENMEVAYGQPWSNHSFAGMAGVEYHTPLGPVSLSLNYYDRAEDKLSILFNIGYLIFNKSAFD